MSRYVLQDMDNRDDDGATWETSGTLADLAGYVDGPLRGDIRDDSAVDVDRIVAEMRAGALSAESSDDLRALGVYVREEQGR